MDAVDCLTEALAGLRTNRPTLSIARAEALAQAGLPEQASQQLRSAVQEPAGRADQPWSLVARVSRVQALIAVGRHDQNLALRRFDEAAAVWERLVPSGSTLSSEGYVASLVDLGRPPVVGLVEPARELARIHSERDRLSVAARTR
jgi:hypothetical protein